MKQPMIHDGALKGGPGTSRSIGTGTAMIPFPALAYSS